MSFKEDGHHYMSELFYTFVLFGEHEIENIDNAYWLHPVP
jgi:hypothetical protein